MNIQPLIRLLLVAVLPFLASCKGGNAHIVAEGGDTIKMEYVENLRLVRHDGFITASVRNPWDTTKTLHTYILVPDSLEIPEGIPDGTVVRTPLKKALIYSSVHNSLVSEFGSIDAIKGVCDARYIHQSDLAERIASGEVADCGIGTSPDIERIITLSPDGIMLSPFENSGTYGKVGQLGIPIIECADYMETSPLGRAEWMKFYGMLFGKEDVTMRMFDDTKREYLTLRQSVDSVQERPRVIVDRLYGQAWYVPAANSTMGIFIKDAGGENPFDDYDRSGSVGLTGEEVLYKASDADVWLVRYSQSTDKTLSELSADNAIYPQFDALKSGRVYGCNTTHTYFYEEVPFHPQWLLNDLITIFHPEKSDVATTRYFTKMKP